MTDELGIVENQEETDPWAAAFAALEQAAGGSNDASGEQLPAGPDGGEGQPADTEPGTVEGTDSTVERPDTDEQLPDVPNPGEPGPGTDGGNQITPAQQDPAEVDEVIKEYQGQARQAAIDTVVEAYKKQGVRCTPDGKLGASLNDPDIAKKDADGTIRYYNPETGREFTGPNPRKDAREWCDEYNKELADQFNAACAKVEQQKMKEYEPAINVLKFAPKYDALDDMRRGLLDDILEDYEIKDKDGSLIGYSCDLDAALRAVERQVARIKSYTPAEPKPATGPEVDMKKGSAKGNSDPEKKPKIESIADALGYLQDQEIEKAKNKKGRR